jgi:hypothetical protein
MLRRLMWLPVIAVFAVTFIAVAHAKASPVISHFAVYSAGYCQKNSFFGLPTWYKNLKFDADCNVMLEQELIDPATGGISKSFDWGVIWGIAFAIIEMLLFLSGMVAVVFIIVSGFTFVTNQGSPDRLATARKGLANALVGAVIAFISSRVVGFISGRWSTGSASYGLINVDASKSGVMSDVFNIVLTAIGALSVLMLIFNGIQFIVSSGNPDRVKRARNGIYYSLLGIAIVLIASALVTFVIKQL